MIMTGSVTATDYSHGEIVKTRPVGKLQRILPLKCHFSFVEKCKFRQRFCHKSRISPVFRHPKMRSFQQCKTVTAVNLFYEVLPERFEAFAFYSLPLYALAMEQ